MTLLQLLIAWLALSLICAFATRKERKSLIMYWITIFVFYPTIIIMAILTGMTYIVSIPINIVDYFSSKH